MTKAEFLDKWDYEGLRRFRKDLNALLKAEREGHLQCKVVVIKLSGMNLCYEVEYWVAYGVKSATLYEDELVADLPQKEAGIKSHDRG